ncbi:MAG: hypothetical protein AAF329_20450 [Cyanobacteria bacterium P01_A01_bin.17]
MDMAGAQSASKVGLPSPSGVFSLDSGNTYTKASFGRETWKFPSYIKELDPDVDEFDLSRLPAGSAVVQLGDRMYAVGEIAEADGSPAFLLGKEHIAHILFYAALSPIIEQQSHPTLKELRFLVPDARQRQIESTWGAVAKRLQGTTDVVINGKRVRPRVDNVRFISEGRPVFEWLKSTGRLSQWLENDSITDVALVDVGGGDTTLAVVDLRTGQLDYQRGLVMSDLGVKALAAAIATKIKPVCHGNPKTSDILKSLHHGDPAKYIYLSNVDHVNFEPHYKRAARSWREQIAHRILESGVMSARLGGCIFFGGGANHCVPFRSAIKNLDVRVLIDDMDSQLINVVAMQGM